LPPAELRAALGYQDYDAQARRFVVPENGYEWRACCTVERFSLRAAERPHDGSADRRGP
jgi:hypothetical protein